MLIYQILAGLALAVVVIAALVTTTFPVLHLAVGLVALALLIYPR